MSLIRASCPHCKASPRYGLERHMQVCQQRPPVSAAEVTEAIEASEVLPSVPKGHCPKCGKHIGKGLHFHRRACKGAS